MPRPNPFSGLRREMKQYADANGYPMARSYAPKCKCGAKVMSAAYGSGTFFIAGDDRDGGALLICGDCDAEGFVADSQTYMRPRLTREGQWRECFCRKRDFQVVVGAAFYADSSDVRWWYVGGRCVHYGVQGVYVDWKDDGTPWEAKLRPRVVPERRRRK
ncbi:MAG: hypothetical protein U0263_30810 [Polyangiaceae bacterium]